MENVYENVRRELTPEVVKEALQVMLERVHLPENEAKIAAAKEQANDDMVEVMKTVFPLVLTIQMEVVGKFGFTSTAEGLKEFLIRVNSLSNEHEEIHELLVKIRECYLKGFNQKNSVANNNNENNTTSNSNTNGDCVLLANGGTSNSEVIE